MIYKTVDNHIILCYHITMKFIDLTNKTFYNLKVISRAPNKGQKVMWNCICKCGNHTIASGTNLKLGKIRSCGCFKIEQLVKRSTTHNQRHTNLYQVWKGIKQRCLNHNSSSYKNYGGRGITICEDWKNNFTSFYEWSMANGYKKGLTIDRIDNNSNYCPENCRWTDIITQANNKRVNKYITINGKVDTLSNWLKFYNIGKTKYYNRLKKGFSEQEALTMG